MKIILFIRNICFKKSQLIFFNHNLKKNVIIKKIIKNFMHRQDAIYLDQFCPKISNKNWRESLNKLTNYKCIYCGKPSDHSTTSTQCQKGGLAVQVIAYHVVCHVMGRNQIQKFLVGTENKIFMILEELWRYEHGLMKIWNLRQFFWTT